MEDFTGRTGLVTGGARGQGRAYALALAERGADLILVDLPDRGRPTSVAYDLPDPTDLEKTANEVRALGRRCSEEQCDVRDFDGVAAVVERGVGEYGAIDFVIANAGIRTPAPAHEVTDGAWAETVDTNVHGVYNVLRNIVPSMVEAGFGRVVVVVGEEGRRGMAGLSHTSAAAWAAIGLAKSVALETAEAGVAVNVLCTAAVDTDMFHTDASYRSVVGPGEPATTETVEHALRIQHPSSETYIPLSEITHAACYLLGRPGVEHTGSVMDVTAGLSALNTS